LGQESFHRTGDQTNQTEITGRGYKGEEGFGREDGELLEWVIGYDDPGITALWSNNTKGENGVDTRWQKLITVCPERKAATKRGT